MGGSKDKIAELEEKEQELKQIECDHDYFCIYRTPTSNLKCKHCDEIITAEKYKMIYGKDILKTQIDNLTKELYNKKQELENQQSPTQQKAPTIPDVIEPLKESLLTKGWICPVCGCGNAPTNKTCPCRTMYKPYSRIMWMELGYDI